MVEEMIKEFAKGMNSGQNEFETNLEGHNIVELTNHQIDYEKKKKCCK